MNCRDFTEFIVDYYGHDLTHDTSGLFELHLSRCRNCRTYLETYRETILLGQAAFADPEAPVPDDVPEELVQAILTAREKLD